MHLLNSACEIPQQTWCERIVTWRAKKKETFPDCTVDFYVGDWAQIFHCSPKHVTWCTFSSASSPTPLSASLTESDSPTETLHLPVTMQMPGISVWNPFFFFKISTDIWTIGGQTQVLLITPKCPNKQWQREGCQSRWTEFIVSVIVYSCFPPETWLSASSIQKWAPWQTMT